MNSSLQLSTRSRPNVSLKWPTDTLTNDDIILARGGIQILQLHLPYRAGFVHVNRNVKPGQKIWNLRTENIRRLGFIYFKDLEQPTDGIYNNINI